MYIIDVKYHNNEVYLLDRYGVTIIDFSEPKEPAIVRRHKMVHDFTKMAVFSWFTDSDVILTFSNNRTVTEYLWKYTG